MYASGHAYSARDHRESDMHFSCDCKVHGTKVAKSKKESRCLVTLDLTEGKPSLSLKCVSHLIYL